MKKLWAVALCLILALSLTAAWAEEPAEKQVFGTLRVNGEFTLKGILPEGYKLTPYAQGDDLFLARIESEDPTRPRMMLDIAFDETYSDVMRFNDLDEDALAILEKTFTDTDPYVNITYDETQLGTRLLLARTTSEVYDYLVIMSIYQGYFVEFAIHPGREAPEQRLTEEQVAACNDFLTQLDFVPGIETGAPAAAKQTATIRIEDFSEADRTLNVVVMAPVTIPAQQADALAEGDLLPLETDPVEITSLRRADGVLILNDEYELRPTENGVYAAYLYESPLLTEKEKRTLAVPDTLVFTDEIEPEFGEFLETPTQGGPAELFAALTAARSSGIGFDSDNVTATFDADGNLTEIVRFYAPWQ